MQIPAKEIVQVLEKELSKKIRQIKKKEKIIKLTVFLIGESPQQLSFVKIKQKIAKKLKVKFDFVYLKKVPSFEEFIHLIKEKSQAKEIKGIIIQQPLPSQLRTESIYDFIDIKKEIEGHKKKTPFFPPLGLAVLTLFKYIYSGEKISKNLFVDLNKERSFFKKIFKNKKVVLVGRGLTGGMPIGIALNAAKINYFCIHSQTPNSSEYFKDADVIISAVGKKVVFPHMLRPGVILINVGLRKENAKLKGDYDEEEIKDIAGYYTSIIGGVGPLDVLYLYKNLIEAIKLQK